MAHGFAVTLLASLALASGAAAQGSAAPPSTGPTTIPAVTPGDSLPRGGATCIDANGDGRCDDAGQPLACPSTAAAMHGPVSPCDSRPTPCPDANHDGHCDGGTAGSASRAALAPDSFYGVLGRSIAGWFVERKGGDQSGENGRVKRQ